MKYLEDFYSIFPQLEWESDAELNRAMALPRITEALLKQRMLELGQEILAISVDEPGLEGEVRAASRNILQGKYLALQELLEDSRNAHGAQNVPNE